MACVCKTCNHWDEGLENEGLCVLDLPPWLDFYLQDKNVYRVTESLDSCEFWNLKRGNA
jgi:hypothetical protein